MERVKEVLYLFKNAPKWTRIVVYVAVAIIALMSLFACGTTRAVVHNGATGTTTEIKITTNNPTSVHTSPNIQLNPEN